MAKEQKYRELLQALVTYYWQTGDAALDKYLMEYAAKDWSGEKANVTHLPCAECHFAFNVRDMVRLVSPTGQYLVVCEDCSSDFLLEGYQIERLVTPFDRSDTRQ
ncbi:MAG: hypothetical protein H6657_25260 [Ardenticatenaceae bacterium]|nr:hypothetical protein [Ardenticatenaceae bacterium]